MRFVCAYRTTDPWWRRAEVASVMRNATRVMDLGDEGTFDRASFWRPHPSPDWGRDWVKAGPVLITAQESTERNQVRFLASSERSGSFGPGR